MSLVRSSAVAAAASVLFLASAPVGQAAGGAPPAPSSNVTNELTEAQLLIDRKDWTGALVELKRALRKDRKNADVHNLMGYSYRKSGQLEEAFDSYRTALRLDSQPPRRARIHRRGLSAGQSARQGARAPRGAEAHLRRAAARSTRTSRRRSQPVAAPGEDGGHDLKAARARRSSASHLLGAEEVQRLPAQRARRLDVRREGRR